MTELITVDSDALSTLRDRAVKAEQERDRALAYVDQAGRDGLALLARAETAEGKCYDLSHAEKAATYRAVKAEQERDDLLEALTDALFALDGVAEGDFKPNGAAIVGAIARARAAIAKIEGENQ